jgi:hypothetical protein
LTVDGKVSPAPDSTVEANLKVMVDTFAPSLLLEPDARRGSLASVRWEVKDENLDLKSLVLEYQVEGAGVWRRVPIRRPKLIGGQQWDAGTAEALKVRASVADRAGNVTEAVIDVAEGTAAQPELPNDLNDESPPAVAQISSGSLPEISAGPDFTPVNSDLSANRRTATRSGRSTQNGRPRSNAGPPRGPRSAPPDRNADEGSRTAAASEPTTPGTPIRDLFATAEGADSGDAIGSSPNNRANSEPPPAAVRPAGRDGGGGTLLVPSSRFKLQYAVEDAGPNGPATVELWITQDGGRTWIRRGDDPDRVSPFDVDLGGEGTYGLCLVARSASGLGDQPPAPGDPPQSWVEVDSTPPVVQLLPPQVGTGANSGKVAIAWRVSDLHLPTKSVTLFWRADQPGADWQTLTDGLENAGQYVWAIPATVPQRFHIKVEAVDSVGHHGSAETTDMGPIMVDRSRPRSRIIGLDPNARAGIGPSARPLR